MMKLTKYISKEQIDEITTKLAKEIEEDYKEHVIVPNEVQDEEPAVVALAILKGASYFFADITRKINIPFNTDFVKLSSYGKTTESSGTVTILQDISVDIKGKHVILFDEIIDSGYTVAFYIKRLMEAKPKSIRVCALIDKKARREKNVNADYTGLVLEEDLFLLGYGLDYAQKYRNLDSIYYLS